MPGSAFRLPAGPISLLVLPLLLVLAACDGDPTGPQAASIDVTAPGLTVEVGGSLQLSATVRDASGNPIQTGDIEWISNNPSRAEVDAQGVVTGIAPGEVEIEARSHGATGSITIEVTGPAPHLFSISPDTLRVGDEASIEGEGFSESVNQNRVRIGGRLATVLEASETSLVVRVPSGVCYPEGPVPVTASLGGGESEPLLHPFDSPGAEPMEVGEFRRLGAGEARCLRLGSSSGSERYIVGAQSVTEEPLSTVRVTMEGRRQGAPVALAGAADGSAVRARILRSGSTFPDRVAPDRWTRHRATKPALRRAEARLVEEALAQRIGAARVGAPAMAAAVPGSVQPGDTVSLSVPDISSGNFCQEGIPVQAVVRRVGHGSIWVEDVENPDGFSPAQYDVLSNLFDDEILEELTDFFGEPTDLDDNDRIVILISQAVNAMSSFALGFVVTVDFFDQCPAGNFGEYYYARSPDPDGVIPGPDGPPDQPYTVSDAFQDAPVLLAHETTHIIQFGRRIAAEASTLARIWELEGQATLAEEVAGFRVRGHGPRQNLDFDVAFGNTGDRDWFSSGFIDLAVYYGFESQSSRTSEAPHECGWQSTDADGPCDYNRLPYGVPWSFLRWISDHIGPTFPGGEQAIHRQMVEHDGAGFETIEAVLGEPVPPLLARWAASLYADGRLPAGADPRLTFPSWDLRDIDEGLVDPARLQPIERSFATFSDERRVAAGASAYYLIEGGIRPDYTLELRPTVGNDLPGFVQLWAVRLQ